MPEKDIFFSLRNGSLGTSVQQLQNEDLSPFLPLLIQHVMRASPSELNFFNEEQTRALRSVIVKCTDGNYAMSFYDINFDWLRIELNDFQKGKQIEINGAYSSLSVQNKALSIGIQLLKSAKNLANTVDSFEPFDSEVYQKETVWIISFLCMRIPQHFNPIDLAQTLFCYNHGVPILLGLLFNYPFLIDQLLDKILSFDFFEHDNAFMRRRKDMINLILQLESTQTERLFKSSIELPTRHRICVEILCNEVVEDQFFVNTLISHLMNDKGVFCQFLIKNVNKQFMTAIRDRFNSILHKQMQLEFKERVVLLLAVLSNYNFLRTSSDTTHLWVRFLTDQTSENLRIMKLVLAVILASPNLLPSNQQAFRDNVVEQHLMDYFSWIRDKSETDASEYAPLNQFMLLVAIHMQNNNGAELSKLLSDELSFDVGDTLRKHFTVKRLFLQYAMPENLIAQKAIMLGVTKDLNANFAGYLPVHCVNHLLSARTFSKDQMPIQDWIKRQLLECQLPIHSFMVQVLENFAKSCFPSRDDSDYLKQIDEGFFWKVFSTDLFSDDKSLAAKVLSLFYLVVFTNRLDTCAVIPQGGKKSPWAYSDKLWAEIPIRYILSVIDARPKEFEMIQVDLLRNIGTSMPHMLPTLDARIDGTEDQLAIKTTLKFKSVPREMFRQSFEHIRTDLNTFKALVVHLEAAPIQEQYLHHETIIQSMLISLDAETCPLEITLKLAKIWRRLANLIPRKLFEQTLQLWLNTPRAATQGPIEINNSVILNETPSLMFRVDDRIFQSPPHFELLMRILSFYLDAVKNYNNVRLIKAISMKENKIELDEKNALIKSYIGAQHLAVVQFLLDICNRDKSKEPNFEDICNIACSQIHQMFVSDPALPKLVHFCMYPVNLIPMVVEKVPSMHVLISAIAELVVPSHLERRIFAVNLISELAQKYTVPSALSAVEFVEDVLSTLLDSSIDEDTIILFLNTAEALGKFIQFGPPHDEVVKCMFKRVKSVAQTRSALYRSEVAFLASPERHLISKIEAIIQ